jgi:hypothetical protein
LVAIDFTIYDRKSLKISRPFTEKKSHRPQWGKNQSSNDPWEDQMRKDCAEKIVLGGKNKKVRGGHLPKKPTQHTSVPDLVKIAIAKGCDQTIEFNGFEVVIRRNSDPQSQSKQCP